MRALLQVLIVSFLVCCAFIQLSIAQNGYDDYYNFEEEDKVEVESLLPPMQEGIRKLYETGRLKVDLTPEDEQVVCEAINNDFDQTDMRINLTSPMTYGEMLRMASWNLKYNFGSLENSVSDTIPLGDVEWKRSIIKLLTNMFMKSCPKEFVDHEFVKTIETFFLIYLASIDPSVSYSSDSQWGELIKSLSDCLDNSGAIQFTSSGYEIAALKPTKKSDEEENSQIENETIEILPPKEVADKASEIDIIIDSMWWIFSFSYGNCYRYAQSKTNFAARMKKLMYKDFFQPMQHRWLSTGTLANFGPILGNFNLITILSNMRYCVTAAYMQNNILDRQLVRPVPVAPLSAGHEASQNMKTGEPLMVVSELE